MIKFDTFPYSQYGMAEGTVRIVSLIASLRNPRHAIRQVPFQYRRPLQNLSTARGSLSTGGAA